MNSIFKFIKTTLLSGIIFLIPLILTVFLLDKALRLVAKLIRPLAKHLPFESLIGIETPFLMAIIVLVLVGFLTGLIAKSGFGKRITMGLEHSILRHIPGYSLFMGMTPEATSHFKVGLARDDEKWEICFIVEKWDDGAYTVFIPGSPNPSSGSLARMPAEAVRETDIPVASALKCLMQTGLGMEELFKAKMGAPKSHEEIVYSEQK